MKPNDTPPPAANQKPAAALDDATCSRFVSLIDLIRETKSGKWRVILDYDNYQDGARVMDGDGNVIAECYDLPPDHLDVDEGTAWQFLNAIEDASRITTD